ncbi:MAG: DUF3318 domain-containing protein [Gemmatimonadota bacterium]|nr:DUF3318 domain-containing protein [Gemmatimonadota bacterium]
MVRIIVGACLVLAGLGGYVLKGTQSSGALVALGIGTIAWGAMQVWQRDRSIREEEEAVRKGITTPRQLEEAASRERFYQELNKANRSLDLPLVPHSHPPLPTPRRHDDVFNHVFEMHRVLPPIKTRQIKKKHQQLHDGQLTAFQN